MIKWLHHLFNPHCPHCKEELEDSKVCNTCEFLKNEVARLQIENKYLLDKLLYKPEEVKSAESDQSLKPIPTSNISVWRAKKQMLEAEDRALARKLAAEREANNQSKVEALEKEILSAQGHTDTAIAEPIK